MKSNDIFSYIYDFLSIIFENKQIKENLKSIILFGSVARGDFHKKSDIDIFFNIKRLRNQKKIEEFVQKSLKTFEIKNKRTWKLKGINLPIKCIIGDIDQPEWQNLREDIISYGITLYGKFEVLPQDIKHYSLISFSFKKLARKDIMSFSRKLYGYENIKGNKKYFHEGLLKKIKGLKLGSNSIIVPLDEVQQIKKLFISYKLNPKIQEIWLRQ